MRSENVKFLPSDAKDSAHLGRSESPADHPCARIVTLVHGTIPHIGSIRLAKAPTWIAPESSLCRAIDRELGGAQFQIFTWSGRNSHRERLSAGHRLREHLECTGRLHPNAEHTIIAHSHGGNVAIYALRGLSPDLRGKVARLVCLGTPFFRSADVMTNWQAMAAAALVPFLAAVSAARPYIGWWLAAAVCLGGALGALFILPRVARWQREAGAWAEQLPSELPSGISVFCACSKRDEAFRWLQIIGSPFRIIRALLYAALGLGIFAIVLPWIILRLRFRLELLNLPFAVMLNKRSLLFPLGDPLTFMSVVPFALEAAGIFVALMVLLAVIVQLVSRSTSYSFGESLPESFVLDTETRSVPPDSWDAVVRYYSFPAFVLHHSVLCENDAVIRDVAAWIQGAIKPVKPLFRMFGV